ncbi:hypothetical protein CLIB1423_19S00628 [[Candida] railenensis]|uniref:Uncharacterized protein n=1 Tax=[Candida] railenensis TaxID=45579 RepID=A0A9P0QSM9_9ASCO|nr:hypothetical protein CLIB1423_19S00628 [[Candida] railenensis]
MFRLLRSGANARSLSLHRRQSVRSFINLTPSQRSNLGGFSKVFNMLAGAYLGGLVICGGSLYWIYSDANERENIPFDISYPNQIEAVKAINKDDVLQSPQYAAKHYRKILQSISEEEPQDNLELDSYDANDKFDFPMIKSKVLLDEKSNKFANFYINIIIRYAKSLLSRNKPESATKILKKIIDNDEIFFNLGNAEQISSAAQLLGKISQSTEVQVAYLMRTIEMLTRAHPSLKIDNQFLIQENCKVTNEFLHTLNSMAFLYAKESTRSGISKSDKNEVLSNSLNIYLSNLKVLTDIQERVSAEKNGSLKKYYPLFDISPLNLMVQIAEIKAHISEVIWAKGFKENAISWGEEVVDLLFNSYNETSRAAPILISTLNNLSTMYAKMNDKVNSERCLRMTQGIEVYELDRRNWHDETLARFSRIIYNRGPLGIIEKALTERYGSAKPIANLEEYDELD